MHTDTQLSANRFLYLGIHFLGVAIFDAKKHDAHCEFALQLNRRVGDYSWHQLVLTGPAELLVTACLHKRAQHWYLDSGAVVVDLTQATPRYPTYPTLDPPELREYQWLTPFALSPDRSQQMDLIVDCDGLVQVTDTPLLPLVAEHFVDMFLEK